MILLSSFKSKTVIRILFLLSCLSVMGSVYLCYILLFILKDICLVCLATYAVNIFICILSFKLCKNDTDVKKIL
uniref:vitamin-K-epoxide reductase (warfarin-sensitive) n=1 Tax=Trichobilharzia regenti TaxID=157069 RepID=A0AA85J5S2_TRIRE|nr:unnamed protein product [Trichobilharzia regenti]